VVNGCHCERPEGAKQSPPSEKEGNYFVAWLLAMTSSAFFNNLLGAKREENMKTELNPYFSFKDNTREAMEFYKSVFGGTLTVSTF